MTSHLDDGTLHELIDGEIPSSALGPVRDHLAACAECRARLDAAQAVSDEADDLVEALDDTVVPARTLAVTSNAATRTNAWIRNAAWAASLVIAVGAGYYARGNPAGPGVTQAREVQERPTGGEPLQASREDVLAPPAAPPVAKTTDPTPSTTSTDAAVSAPTEATSGVEPPRREAARETPAATGAAAAAENRAPTAARPQLGEGVSIEVPDPLMRRTLGQERAPDMVSRDQAAAKQAGDASAADTISFTDAVRRLGGRLLLIEGMIPARLELNGAEVRVVYRVPEGEIMLIQAIRAGAVSHRLVAPPGFPADSVAALERRIKG